MKKLILIPVITILLSHTALAEQWECTYSDDEGGQFSMTLNKSKYHRCPPAMKKFYKLESQNNFTVELIPLPSGGGGGMIFSMEQEEKIPLNASCLHKCSICYDEGSDVWLDCMQKSLNKKSKDATEALMAIVVIFILFCGIIIRMLIPKSSKKSNLKKDSG